jgi:hypothetical protein
VAGSEGSEPPALAIEIRCSIQRSYERARFVDIRVAGDCAVHAGGLAHPARRPGSRLIRLVRTRLAFVDAAEEIACADAAGH